jgi:hypothetical protein
MHHINRCHLRGEELRSKSRLPGRSLLPSSTLKHVSALRPSRTFDRSAHQNFRTDSRDPPDLGANYPDAFRSLRPGRKAGFPLVGLSKDRPSIVSITESDSRKRLNSASPRRPARIAARPPPSEWERQFPSSVPSSWFRTTLTAYSSATSQPCCMLLPIMGFTAFLPVAKQDSPPCTCCPSKPSLRRQRRKLGRILASVGPRHRSDRLRPSRSPRTLPPRPFSHRTSDAVSRILVPMSRGLEALLHRRVRCALERFRSLVPGAPLGLAGSPARAVLCSFPASGVPSPRTGRAVQKTTRTNCRHHVKDHSEE